MRFKKIAIIVLILIALTSVPILSIQNILPLQAEESIVISDSEFTDEATQNALLVIWEPTSDSHIDSIYYQWLRALIDAEGIPDDAAQ